MTNWLIMHEPRVYCFVIHYSLLHADITVTDWREECYSAPETVTSPVQLSVTIMPAALPQFSQLRQLSN